MQKRVENAVYMYVHGAYKVNGRDYSDGMGVVSCVVLCNKKTHNGAAGDASGATNAVGRPSSIHIKTP
jgi:hypothetical protein